MFLTLLTSSSPQSLPFSVSSSPLFPVPSHLSPALHSDINQSINQTFIGPISPAKAGSVARQPNQCSTAKLRKRFLFVVFCGSNLSREGEIFSSNSTISMSPHRWLSPLFLYQTQTRTIFAGTRQEGDSTVVTLRL